MVVAMGGEESADSVVRFTITVVVTTTRSLSVNVTTGGWMVVLPVGCRELVSDGGMPSPKVDRVVRSTVTVVTFPG